MAQHSDLVGIIILKVSI